MFFIATLTLENLITLIPAAVISSIRLSESMLSKLRST